MQFQETYQMQPNITSDSSNFYPTQSSQNNPTFQMNENLPLSINSTENIPT
jgi:hypothetical protein